MSVQQFDKWTDMVKNLQKPLQDIIELNVKTVQSLNYLQPEDLSKVKKPEELVDKQIKLAIENGHKALDYMRESFDIMEKAMLGLVQESKKAAKAAAEAVKK